MENILGVLGLTYGTDKVYQHHYHIYYHDVLHHLRDKFFNMLEVGVQGFNSIDMWKQYFPVAKIYGIDIEKEYTDHRITVYRGDQSKKEDLEDVIQKMKVKCDFINDDGSHIPEHQLLTFDIFFSDLLNPGGVYIIEDIETSYWKRNGLYGYPTNYGYKHQNSVIEKFKDVLDYINRRYMSDTDVETVKEKVKFLSEKTLQSISSITFAQNCIIIKKKCESMMKKQDAPYYFSMNV
jgi:hypothetical protein